MADERGPDLRRINDTIAEKWLRDCEQGAYPVLAHMDNQETREHFHQTHAFLHLSKRLGQLGLLIEPIGHGRKLSPEQRLAHLETIAKLIGDAVAYARFSGFTIEELENALEGLCAKVASEVTTPPNAAAAPETWPAA